MDLLSPRLLKKMYRKPVLATEDLYLIIEDLQNLLKESDSKLGIVYTDATLTGSGTQLDPLSVVGGGGGGEDLFATLTIGNDGGGLDIKNVLGLRDSTNIRSIDIENRKLINNTGLLFTLDWDNRLTVDSSGQTSIDWESRALKDNTLTTTFDWQSLSFPTLGGSGDMMLMVDNTGAIGTMTMPIPGGANLWAYKAKTSATSGDPGTSYMLWNNATQISATQININHITDDGVDIDLLLAYISSGNTLIVQDADNSTNYQKWTVSGSITIHANSYVEVPVTFVSSSGTGTTNFSNNHRLVIAKISASGGGVSSVSGTANRITSTGGSTPVINIDSAYDALWQPVDADLTSIAGLGFTSTAFLKKTAANTWALDISTYLTAETDPVWLADKPSYLTSATAASTYQPVDGDLTAIAALGFTSTAFLKKTAANTWALDTNTYLTSFTETDPIFTAWLNAPSWVAGSTGKVILEASVGGNVFFSETGFAPQAKFDISSLTTDRAFAFPDNAGTFALLSDLSGFLTVEVDPVFTASAAFGISSGDISNWNTAYGWGNHASAGYLVASNNLSDVSNATTARNNILPSKVGNALKYLRVNAGATDYEVVTLAGGGDLLSTNNLSDVANAATSRTNLGATAIGSNIFTVTSASAIRFIRINADDTITLRSAGLMLSDLGGQPLDTGLLSLAGLANTPNGIMYATGLDAYALLSQNTTATRKFLREVSSTAPAWDTLQAGDIPDISATYLTLSAAAAAYQPLDTQLTDLAALTYTANGGKLVRVNAGATAFELFTASYGDALVANPLSQFAATTSAQLAGVISDEVGSDKLVFNTSPQFATDIRPTANDSASIGISGTAFSDLFLASGAVINFNAGNATLTHSAGLLTSNVNIAVPDDAFSASWNGSVNVPTKNAVFDAFNSTSGVANSPSATQTDTIIHSLGRIPTIIRIYGIGTFTSNAAATPTTFSIGIWNSSGNRCIYQAYNTAAITTTQASATSTTFAVMIQTGANSFISGVIQNVGATTFDIAWTETGTSSAQKYLWEAE